MKNNKTKAKEIFVCRFSILGMEGVAEKNICWIKNEKTGRCGRDDKPCDSTKYVIERTSKRVEKSMEWDDDGLKRKDTWLACSNCKKPVTKNQKYCAKCGAKLKGD